VLKVLFFASVRERLNCASVDYDGEFVELDLDGLQAWLIARGGQEWRETLMQENVIRAVNQAVVAENCPLVDGDEVAFFPPVTGG
jgi:molybdopterin synthase sulfur carrier subunit